MTNNLSLKYIYTPLSSLTDIGEYNFYGVIIDSSFPILDSSSPDNIHFECTLKLIDQNVNLLTHPSNYQDHIINLIIKTSDKANIPFIHNIGDIIRVHRGYYSPKKRRNVYLQILKGNQMKSSWCVFSGASDILSREMTPYLCSHQNFTFEQQDRHIIENMRMWIRNYFDKEKSLLYEREYPLLERGLFGSDSDALVQVVHKVELEDQIVFFVHDDSDGCELHTFKYFNFIEVNDVLRLRSYKLFDKNVILMNTFSNILKVPQFSSLYKTFMNKLALKLKEIEPSLDIPLFKSNTTSNDNNNKEDNVHIENTNEPKCSIEPIIQDNIQYEYMQYNEVTPENKEFILKVNILEIYPKPVYNFVNVLCENCNNVYLISEIEVDKDGNITCEKCKRITKGKMHFNATIQCREKNISNQLITVHLCTYDGEGKNFFGIEPVDSYRNSNEFQKLGEMFKKLCEPDNYVSLLVRQYEGNVLRIIGEYKHNEVE